MYAAGTLFPFVFRRAIDVIVCAGCVSPLWMSCAGVLSTLPPPPVTLLLLRSGGGGGCCCCCCRWYSRYQDIATCHHAAFQSYEATMEAVYHSAACCLLVRCDDQAVVVVLLLLLLLYSLVRCDDVSSHFSASAAVFVCCTIPGMTI